ncbi:MAG: tetratricopeptide repeat protein [Thermoanaerobaculia bacterium]
MSQPTPIFAFGAFVVDPAARQLLRDGSPTPLTPKAFDVLCALLQNAGRTVTKEELMRAAWPDSIVDEGNLAFQISTLRKALGDRGSEDRYVVTVPGQGYQFVRPVRVIEHEELELAIEERDTTAITIEEPSSRSAWILAAGAVAILLISALAWGVIWRNRATVPVSREIQSLAVLPFKPIVPAERDEALELGMADALISRIGGNGKLLVRPLTAVRGYGGIEQDAVDAGRELGVDAVLDGTILSTGDRIRVTARLVRVADNVQIWSGQFDERSSEILSVQDSISRRLSRELDLTPAAGRVRIATASEEAYRAYALGRLHYFRSHSVEVDKAIGHFKRAIALDEEYADAWAGLADSYAILPISADREPRENYGLARQAAMRAIELDPSSAEAYMTLGTVKFFHDWDWSGSEADFLRALELDPGSAIAHIRYAHLLSNTGRHEEAMVEARRAQRIDPLSLIINTLTGQFSLQAGDVDEGIRQLRHTLELDPDYWIARMNLGKAYEMRGEYDRALEELEKCRGRSGDNVEPLWMIGYIHGLRGEREKAQAVVDELLEAAGSRHIPAAKIALVYIGMGNRDEAFRWLFKACRDRDRTLAFLDANPRFRKLEDDPRFATVASCVDLPQLRAR